MSDTHYTWNCSADCMFNSHLLLLLIGKHFGDKWKVLSILNSIQIKTIAQKPSRTIHIGWDKQDCRAQTLYRTILTRNGLGAQRMCEPALQSPFSSLWGSWWCSWVMHACMHTHKCAVRIHTGMHFQMPLASPIPSDFVIRHMLSIWMFLVSQPVKHGVFIGPRM